MKAAWGDRLNSGFWARRSRLPLDWRWSTAIRLSEPFCLPRARTRLGHRLAARAARRSASGRNVLVPGRGREGLKPAHRARCGAFRRTSPFFGSQPAFSLSAGTALHAPTPAVRNTPSGPARLSGERSFATTHLWSHSLRCVPSFPDPGWVCCGEQRKPNSIRRLMSSAVQRWVRSSAVDCSAPAKEPSGFSVRVTM